MNFNKQLTVKICGDIVETIDVEHPNTIAHTIRISKKEYMVVETGEIKEINPYKNRTQNMQSLRRSMAMVVDLINTNTTDISKCRWVTLTYTDNMTDTKKLYKDFKNFRGRLKRRYKKDGYEFEYLSIYEPQSRGAWHIHMLLIFNKTAPFLENDEIYRLWGHNGYVSAKRVFNNGNAGLYYTAKISDTVIDDLSKIPKDINKKDLKYIIVKERGRAIKKAVIKGDRLHLYPPGFNFYSNSRGLKKPIKCKMTYDEVEQYIKNLKKVKEYTHEITDDNGNIINRIIKKTYKKQKAKRGKVI